MSAFLSRPRWRSTARFDETAEGFRAHLRSTSCLIECCSASRAPLRRLLTRLNEGVEVTRLAADFDDFAEEAAGVLDQLDRFGYLTDAHPKSPAASIDAREFRHRLQCCIDSAMTRGPGAFATALIERKATRRQLVQYAVQYFQIVRHAPALVANVVNGPWPPALRSRLADFIGEEWRHDRLLATALLAVGIDAAKIAAWDMLPETFAVLAQLAVRAHNDPLALAALLHLFERPNATFHEAFAACCTKRRMPAAFSQAILAHAEMNEGGRHEDIAEALIHAIVPVPQERAEAALADAFIAVEHLVRLDAAIARA